MTRTALDGRNRRRQREPSDSADTKGVPEARFSRFRHVGFLGFQGRRGCPPEAAPAAPAGIPLSLFIKTLTDNDENPLERLSRRPQGAPMNIPIEVARAQAEHGIKGAVHGIKGGRPKLDLTDDERAKRRRAQHEAYRRRNGIPPKEVLTREERQQRNEREHQERWNEEYRGVWGKLPGETLTAGEFAARQNAFRAWIRACQARRSPLHWPVDFVRRHFREERRRQRAEELQSLDGESLQRAAERKTQAQPIRKERQRSAPFPSPVAATPSVGRNHPCPCGSGRKFKKCCGP